MATFAATPRRTLTAEERRERNKEYRVEVKDFGNHLKSLVQLFAALTALNAALGSVGKGAYLAFPNPQTPGVLVPFNRKHLRSANAKFTKSILLLKTYFRESKKKPREAILPESFSGTYTPVFAGDALRTFFTNGAGNFGPFSPRNAVETGQAGQALMDALAMVKQGYLLRNTSTMLFYIYAHAYTYVDPATGEQHQGLQDGNNAQFARSDDVMTQAFGGAIAAAFYSYKVNVPGKTGKNKTKTVKLPMAQAVAQGLITAPMNTYQVIRASYPTFNPARFNTYFYQNIAAANYFSSDALTADPALAGVADYLRQEDVRAAMLREHNLVKAVSAEWHSLLEPGRDELRKIRKKEADAKKKAEKAAGRA